MGVSLCRNRGRMKKEVIVSINGLHTAVDIDDRDNVEMIAPGQYYLKNGKHYILYDEISEETNDVNRNTIKVNDKIVEIIRKGASSAHMVFEEGKKNVSYYTTPFGNLLIGLNANKVDVHNGEDEMNISIDYSLEVNYEHLSDCVMTLNIKSKEGASITLS